MKKLKCFFSKISAKKIDWGNLLFIAGYHLALLLVLPFYFFYNPFPTAIFFISLIVLYLCGLGITGGYHRLFSHQTFRAPKWLQAIFLFFGTLATQGSALQWAYDHRLHHAHVDSDKDPYTITKGFFHAHMLWMFKKRPNPEKSSVVSDLLRNPLIVFQHRYFVPLMIISNTAVSLLFGWLFQDYLSSFIFIWWVRLFLLHHFTWCINSLAHTWGAQSFSKEHSAVDNYIISLITFGEGYHNYHHTFASDYRNGIKWYHFDPTKWLIWVLYKLGFASNLKKVHHLRIKERIVIEQKRELTDRIKKYWFLQKNMIEEKIEKMTEDLLLKLKEIKSLINEYKTLKKEKNKKSLKLLSLKIKNLKKSLNEDWKTWNKMSKNIIPKWAEKSPFLV